MYITYLPKNIKFLANLLRNYLVDKKIFVTLQCKQETIGAHLE